MHKRSIKRAVFKDSKNMKKNQILLLTIGGYWRGENLRDLCTPKKFSIPPHGRFKSLHYWCRLMGKVKISRTPTDVTKYPPMLLSMDFKRKSKRSV